MIEECDANPKKRKEISSAANALKFNELASSVVIIDGTTGERLQNYTAEQLFEAHGLKTEAFLALLQDKKKGQ